MSSERKRERERPYILTDLQTDIIFGSLVKAIADFVILPPASVALADAQEFVNHERNLVGMQQPLPHHTANAAAAVV